MSVNDPSDHRLDHVVVLMFENHSFDSLLGYLYGPGETPSFEGVAGRTLSNPVPSTIRSPHEREVSVHPATSMATPYPDPGEEYPHVNTQLFGTVNPDSNEFASIPKMVPPFNLPSPTVPATPPMNGFVRDYVNAFTVQMDRFPQTPEYAQIMACYAPDQVPVLSGLARGFACFDHWFCEVPSQTYANRSFFHAASSSGFVVNGHPPGKFALRNTARTVFNQLEEHGRTWRVYVDPAQILPATGLIHARQLDRFFATNFRPMVEFYDDARKGTLPDYAFIEPNMFHPHTDMHPHSGARWAEALGLPLPDTIVGGERLLAQVYESVRTASSSSGSHWANTALLVTFDEHGGTFDHVPPPGAAVPDPTPGEMGFPFDRLGVRVPSILVSAWIDPEQVVNDRLQHTSLIRTLRDRWSLGDPLTARDAAAPSLLPWLTRATPRPPETWPSVEVRKGGLGERAEQMLLRHLDPLDADMERLERDLLGDALAHESRVRHEPVAADSESVSHREAHVHFERIGRAYFPQLASAASG